MAQVVGLIVLGFAGGLMGAIAGLGGGILITPILSLYFGIPIHQSIGVSLVAVIATSTATSSVYVERHLTDMRLGTTRCWPGISACRSLLDCRLPTLGESGRSSRALTNSLRRMPPRRRTGSAGMSLFRFRLRRPTLDGGVVRRRSVRRSSAWSA